MTLLELAEMQQIQLEMLYPDTSNQWYVHLKYTEVKGDGVLIGLSGRGSTPSEALEDYVNKIKGKIIVVGGRTDKRREFKVPETVISGVAE